MSLNWDLSRIKDNDTLCWVPRKDDDGKDGHRMNTITDALIWSTTGVGLGQITEKNHLDFFARCQLLSKLSGPPIHQLVKGKRVGIDFTLADIKAHIGLSTNVSTEKAASFVKRVGLNFLHDEQRSALKAAAKTQDA